MRNFGSIFYSNRLCHVLASKWSNISKMSTFSDDDRTSFWLGHFADTSHNFTGVGSNISKFGLNFGLWGTVVLKQSNESKIRNPHLKRQWQSYLFSKFRLCHSPISEISWLIDCSSENGMENVLNLLVRATVPHQKYMTGCVLGWSWNVESDVRPTPPLILQGV